MKRVYVLLLTAAVLTAVCIAGCRTTNFVPADQVLQSAGGDLRTVTPEELAGLLSEDEVFLINVFSSSIEIEGTDLSISFPEIEANPDLLPGDKDTRVVVYCRTGSTSQVAVESLARLGYTDVYNLQGGMIAWQSAGYPLISD